MASIRTWLSAHDYFKAARDKHEGRPLGVETRLVISRMSETADTRTDRVTYAIRYHSTELVRYYPDGNIGVNLGGWDTKTSKERIKDYSPVSIWSTRGETVLAVGGWQADLCTIPIDIEKEYRVTPHGTVILPNGAEVKDTLLRVRLPRSEGDARRYVTEPPHGNVVVSPEGSAYVVIKKPYHSYRNPSGPTTTLQRYLGDHDFDRNYVYLTDEQIAMSELFAMTMADWKPGKRFVRSFDN